ncbi:MAG TPA: hypothetical protein VKA09_06660 [Nitrososphaeraceae archaeon]|nr:hypothetical protein [Nitrososphaeraceae archaeon]
MMNRTLKTTLVLMPGIVISAILMAISAGATNNQEATAQTANATTAANQTGPSNANITSGDFSDTSDNLEMARNAMFDNDTYTAFFALNDADNALFGVVGGTVLQQQTTPVRDLINNAQDAVVNQDLEKALQDVNSASVELIKVTQQLPTDEEEEVE